MNKIQPYRLGDECYIYCALTEQRLSPVFKSAQSLFDYMNSRCDIRHLSYYEASKAGFVFAVEIEENN